MNEKDDSPSRATQDSSGSDAASSGSLFRQLAGRCSELTSSLGAAGVEHNDFDISQRPVDVRNRLAKLVLETNTDVSCNHTGETAPGHEGVIGLDVKGERVKDGRHTGAATGRASCKAPHSPSGHLERALGRSCCMLSR